MSVPDFKSSKEIIILIATNGFSTAGAVDEQICQVFLNI
jgi:hypothetical protein